jgi:microcompartment protein CcmL/EutN
MLHSLGLLEVKGWSPAMLALDAAEKSADIRVAQAELNDFFGVLIKFIGETAAVQSALAAASEMSRRLRVEHSVHFIAAPSAAAQGAWLAQPEVNPLIEQAVVHDPHFETKGSSMSDQSTFAIGFIETQGFTAVIQAIDTAAKAAAVEILGREKLGGGYITVVIKGDTAAVQAAIDAGKAKVEGLGKLIAAHVIPRPSAAVLGLLPK